MTEKNRYSKVLSRLPDTLEWCKHQDIEAVKDFLIENDGLPRIFLGSGGSLSAALLAMQLSVETGIVATFMTPYQYIFSAWSKLPAKVFILSAGGRNIDAINAYRTAHDNPKQTVGAMLMSTPSLLENKMTEDGETNSFVYKLHNGDGFLATNSLAAFYALLFKIYRNEEIDVDDLSFSESLEAQLKEFIASTYTLQTQEWDSHNAAVYEARETDRFYMLYSPDTMPIAYDLESRFSEGSVGCLQISDYRNFAHGRFNWFHQRKGQTAILALVSPESKKIAEGILSELPSDIAVMRIETQFEGTRGTMDLLLQGMYLAKFLGLRWGLDVGAPNVAAFGKVIHNKDFMASQHEIEEENYELANTISDNILELPILNIAKVSGNIVRGETLWASRNRKHLAAVKEAGVEVIIDFRTADFTDKFSELCRAKGLDYYHFPIDKANVSDTDLLKSLPILFEKLDNRNCYISCQQGLHRTDIALAIYYMFHRPNKVPILFGHNKNGVFRCDDIMRRLNSLYASLTPEISASLNLSFYNEAEYRRRREILLDTNRRAIEATSH